MFILIILMPYEHKTLFLILLPLNLIHPCLHYQSLQKLKLPLNLSIPKVPKILLVNPQSIYKHLALNLLVIFDSLHQLQILDKLTNSFLVTSYSIISKLDEQRGDVIYP